jgi:RNA polymerase sigma-70 factor (ECF subfamily)
MLRRNPSVRRWADTADVFQNAAVRLLRALDSTPVADTRAFFNLAAAVIRRELIDLARHFHGPHGLGANHASVAPGDSAAPQAEPPAPADDPDELGRWAALHQSVEELPVEQREVFGLRFYHRWEEARIAELFGVDERTVRRRWRAACAAIHDALGGELPDGGETE